MRVPSHRRGVALAAAVLVALATATTAVVPATARAATRDCTISWVAPGNGAWMRAANWSPARHVLSSDRVCLPFGPTPHRITVDGVRHMDTLFTGDASIVLTAGSRIGARHDVHVDGAATVSGGTLSAGSLYLDDGHALTATSTVLNVSGTVLTGHLHLRDAAALSGLTLDTYGGDIDGDTATAVRERWGVTAHSGTATVDAPLFAYGIIVRTGATLAVLQLPGLQPDGTATFERTSVEPGATLIVAWPITTLLTGLEQSDFRGAVLAASTGRSAFERLRRVGSTASVLVGGVNTDLAPLRVDGMLTLWPDSFTVPSVVVTTAAYLSIGDMTLRTSGGVTLQAGASLSTTGPTVLEGDLEQGNGTVGTIPSHGTVIDGTWTSKGSAVLSVEADLDERATPVLHVTGDADLRGRLYFSVIQSPARGDSITVVSADGRLSAHFTTVDAPGWKITTTAHQVVATYTG